MDWQAVALKTSLGAPVIGVGTGLLAKFDIIQPLDSLLLCLALGALLTWWAVTSERRKTEHSEGHGG